MLYSFKLLKKGDKVLNVWENRVAILRKNGEVDIFNLVFEKGSFARIDSEVINIGYGNETIEVTDRKSKNTSVGEGVVNDDDDDDFVVSIKSPKSK
jgi:hypothetical protein